MVKVRRSSSAGSPSVKMAATMSRGPAGLPACLIRASARSLYRAASCCIAKSSSSSLVPK